MRKGMKIILSIISVGVLLTLIVVRFNPWVFLPTKSSSRMITLVRHGGPFPNRIIMRHYLNDVPINDYVLDLKVGLRNQQPQKYMLPEVNEGRVEVSIEFEDGVVYENNKILTMNYERANSLYNEGLLIFLATDYKSSTNMDDFVYYNQYVHFISGKQQRTYFEKAGHTEWLLVTDAPPPIKFTRKDVGYSSLYYGWKENEWVIISPENN